MRQRIRPAYPPAQLAEIYAQPHDHHRWRDHVLRAEATIALCRWWNAEEIRTVADLSCGDGYIAAQVAMARSATAILGDLAGTYAHHGPIEKTIDEIGPVDLFICTETLEHLDDPDSVLRQIRRKAGHLVVSTPDAEPFDGDPDHSNPEHYWTWDQAGVCSMLVGAGWQPEASMQLQVPGLNVAYQLWACS